MLHRHIYVSAARRPLAPAELAELLDGSRRRNAAIDVTGLMLYHDGSILQILEGPEDKVRQALARITRDDRHLEVKVHVAEHAPARVFGDWAMLHDPAATWIWSQREVADDAVERATPDEVRGFFLRLRDEIDAPGVG